MKTVVVLLLSTVAFLLNSNQLDADIIATVDIDQQGGLRAVDGIGDVNFEVFSTNVGGPNRLHTVYEDLVLSVNDIGNTYRADSSLYSGFDDMVLFLTNGINDRFGDWLTIPHGLGSSGSGSSNLESNIFSTASLNGIDLQGYQLDFFTLRLDGMTFTSPGSDPNSDGIWTDYTFDATLFIHGAIPEPSGGLILIGFSMFVLNRRRSQMS